MLAVFKFSVTSVPSHYYCTATLKQQQQTATSVLHFSTMSVVQKHTAVFYFFVFFFRLLLPPDNDDVDVDGDGSAVASEAKSIRSAKWRLTSSYWRTVCCTTSRHHNYYVRYPLFFSLHAISLPVNCLGSSSPLSSLCFCR